MNDNDKVIIKNGQRASGLMSEQDANKEAASMRQKINEKSGQPARESTVQVKTNICG